MDRKEMDAAVQRIANRAGAKSNFGTRMAAARSAKSTAKQTTAPPTPQPAPQKKGPLKVQHPATKITGKPLAGPIAGTAPKMKPSGGGGVHVTVHYHGPSDNDGDE